MTSPRFTWVRAGDRYPDLKHDLDHFIALDESDTEIGVVKLVSSAGEEKGGRRTRPPLEKSNR